MYQLYDLDYSVGVNDGAVRKYCTIIFLSFCPFLVARPLFKILILD